MVFHNVLLTETDSSGQCLREWLQRAPSRVIKILSDPSTFPLKWNTAFPLERQAPKDAVVTNFESPSGGPSFCAVSGSDLRRQAMGTATSATSSTVINPCAPSRAVSGKGRFM